MKRYEPKNERAELPPGSAERIIKSLKNNPPPADSRPRSIAEIDAYIEEERRSWDS